MHNFRQRVPGAVLGYYFSCTRHALEWADGRQLRLHGVQRIEEGLVRLVTGGWDEPSIVQSMTGPHRRVYGQNAVGILVKRSCQATKYPAVLAPQTCFYASAILHPNKNHTLARRPNQKHG